MTTATDEPQATAEYDKPTKSDIFMVDPRALEVDWSQNVSRGMCRPPIDDELIELARSMVPTDDGANGQRNPIIVKPLPGPGGRKRVVGDTGDTPPPSG